MRDKNRRGDNKDTDGTGYEIAHVFDYPSDRVIGLVFLMMMKANRHSNGDYRDDKEKPLM